MAQEWLEFVYLKSFERAARAADFGVEEQRALELALTLNPSAGDIIVGAAGFRKIRFRMYGTGKRGGYRVVYFYRSQRGRIYLATVYRKGVKESLTAVERATLHELAKQLRREL